MAGPAPNTKLWTARENRHKESGLYLLVGGQVEVSDADKQPVLTEGQAKERYGSDKVYPYDCRAMKNVLAGRNERAHYKMICDSETGKILGLHMIGPDTPEILQAAAIAVKAGLTKADFDATVALHPTMAEELVLMR